jgi:hypothetical protein
MSGGTNPSASVTPDQQRAIESLFENLPESYPERTAAMQSLRGAFYAELAKQLAPTLTAYARTQPCETELEYRNLANWVNDTARHFGVSVVCPVSHKPALLCVDLVGKGRQSDPKFRFQTKTGHRNNAGRLEIQKLGVSEEFPDLELVQRPDRVENFSKKYSGPMR